MDKKKCSSTKVVSIRFPVDELQQIDADAKAAGMRRNDYVRARLAHSNAFVKAEQLTQLADELHQLVVAQSSYIRVLSRKLDLVKEHPKDQQVSEIYAIVTGEIARAEELMVLLFRSGRRAVRLLRKFQRETD